MFRRLWLFVLFFTSILTYGQSSSHGGAAKYVPENGKKLLIIGQDLGAVGGLDNYPDGYVDHITGIPAAVTTYTNLSSLSGLTSFDNWGSGDVHASAYLDDNTFDNSAIAIGLYIVNQLDNIISGSSDQSIEDLGKWIKEADRPVFLRIGYEFDGSWNAYDPNKFKAAWIYIVNKFDEKDVRNVAYVWQSAGINTANIDRWYPGDEYVNWVGYSNFDGPNPGQSIRDFADLHDKPIMIAEATPRVDLKTGSGADHWKNWFKPLFDEIFANDRIKALAYINVDWDSQSMWTGQGWGDSRVQIDSAVKSNWEIEMAKDNWLFGDEDLFDILDYTIWQDSAYLSVSSEVNKDQMILIQNVNGIIVRSANNNNFDSLEICDMNGRICYKNMTQSSEYLIPSTELPADSFLVLKTIIKGKYITRKVIM